MTLYVRKRDLVSVKKFKEEREITTQIGKQTLHPGELALMDTNGNVRIVNEEWFEDTYVEVEKVKKQRKRIKSPFEEQYEKQLMEFGGLENNVEDQEYITGTEKISKNNNI